MFRNPTSYIKISCIVTDSGSSVPGAQNTNDAPLDTTRKPLVPLLADDPQITHTKENTLWYAPARSSTASPVLHPTRRTRIQFIAAKVILVINNNNDDIIFQ